MSNKFEKDSLEELKNFEEIYKKVSKEMDDPQLDREFQRIASTKEGKEMIIKYVEKEVEGNTIIFDSDNYNKPLTVKGMMEAFDKFFEGATDDNHRFKLTEK